jgi:hypothetical protein
MSEDRKIFGQGELVEYKGVFSLIAVREYQGKFYQKRMEFGKDKTLSEKSEPFKVVLGSKEDAIKALKAIFAEIAGVGLTDEVPF